MQTIPLKAVPNQRVQVLLNGQPCSLHIYQLAYGLFIDAVSGTSIIAAGNICENANRIVRYAYRGFVGDLAFLDTQGEQDPDYTGLGGRYQLVYLEPVDLAGA